MAQPGEGPSRLPELAADQLWLFALKLGRGKNERKKKKGSALSSLPFLAVVSS